MFSKSKKMVSSTILFASAPALALQAHGRMIDGGPFDGASQELNFLRDIQSKDAAVSSTKKFAYRFGIFVVIAFLVWWGICIDNNWKLLKNFVNVRFKNANSDFESQGKINTAAEDYKKNLYNKKEACSNELNELREKQEKILQHSKILKDRANKYYLPGLKSIKERIEDNIKIRGIVAYEFDIVNRKKMIEEKSEELAKTLGDFAEFGLKFDVENLVSKVLEASSQKNMDKDFFKGFMENEIKKPIKDLEKGMRSKAAIMLEGLKVTLLEEYADNPFGSSNPDDSVFDLTEVDADKTFPADEERKKDFKEMVTAYKKLARLQEKSVENIRLFFCSIADDAQKIRDFKTFIEKTKQEGELKEISVDVFVGYAQLLLNECEQFFTKFGEKRLNSFSNSLREKIDNFKSGKYRISEFDPDEVMLSDLELRELEEYVDKKISDFEKDVEETNGKISSLEMQKANLEEEIKKCDDNLNSIKIEDLTPCKRKAEFYKEQKEKLEKNWWKPCCYEFEEYEENNEQLQQLGE